MRLAQKLLILLVVLLGIITFPLVGAHVEASYFESYDTTIFNSSEKEIGQTGFPVALHVGTLVINSVGGGPQYTLYNIQLRRSGDFGDGDEYVLESSKKINWMEEFGAQLIAKITFGSHTEVRTINWENGKDPLLGESAFENGQYPITIEFYLGIRNIYDKDQAKGVRFQFDGDTLGRFKIRYRTSLKENTLYDIPFKEGPQSKPFFSIDYSDDSSNYLNSKDFDPRVQVSLSILQASYEKSIDLLAASGLSRAKVGQAKLTLSGNKGSSSQGVTLTFYDGNGSTDANFLLRHKNMPSFIPFSLYLAGEKVANGQAINWANLTYGQEHLKDLHVGNIDYQAAASEAEGEYSDTITVNLTPIDSNLVGR